MKTPAKFSPSSYKHEKTNKYINEIRVTLEIIDNERNR